MEYLVTIKEIKKLNYNVSRFIVEKPLKYSFIPGQATEVSIDEEGFRDKDRPFTFTSLPSDTDLEFVIKKYPVEEYPNHTGVTEKLHTLDVGDKLFISKPFGTIQYKGKGVFLAGGVGITPFISIFRDLHSKTKLSDNKLFFSNSTPKDVFLKKWLEGIFNKENLYLVLSKKDSKGFLSGRIDEDLIKEHIDNYNQYFYICGPPAFEREIKDILLDLGVGDNLIIGEGW